MLGHVFTDADNTLWNTNAVFADAQLAMLREMENLTGRAAPVAVDGGLAFLRALDQRIAALHGGDLRYPPSLLAHGLEQALFGRDTECVALSVVAKPAARSRDFDPIVTRFVERLRAIPALRSGVLDGLTAVREIGVNVTIVTETSPERCKHVLDAHDIAKFVQRIVSDVKSPELYYTLRRQTSAQRVMMVGDQIDRDMAYAYRAGFETFFFPGEFVPYWHGSTDFVPDHQIASYDEIIPHLITL